MTKRIFAVLYVSIMELTSCYKTTVFTSIFIVFLLNLFYSRNGQEGRTASLWLISLNLLELRPTYGDFSRWRPPHLEITDAS